MTIDKAKDIINENRLEQLNNTEVKDILKLLELFADVVCQTTENYRTPQNNIKQHKTTQNE
jgi:hypothetical protein